MSFLPGHRGALDFFRLIAMLPLDAASISIRVVGDGEMHSLNISGLIIAVAMLTIVGATSAKAVSCEDVRSLTRAEQEYWSKRLNLTREQRHQIWQACYGRRSGRAGIKISDSAQ